MKIVLSLLLLTAFGLSYAAQTSNPAPLRAPVRHERAPQPGRATAPARSNARETEIARLHEEIKAKTIAYENEHAIAKSNPKDEKLHARVIELAREIQALQAKVTDLESLGK